MLDVEGGIWELQVGEGSSCNCYLNHFLFLATARHPPSVFFPSSDVDFEPCLREELLFEDTFAGGWGEGLFLNDDLDFLIQVEGREVEGGVRADPVDYHLHIEHFIWSWGLEEMLLVTI